MRGESVEQMQRYYNQRAGEYEQGYYQPDPLLQQEIAALAAAVHATMRDHRVLEVACGTGFWTAKAASIAARITAIDASAEMLALARVKNLPADRVQFIQGDAYRLDEVAGEFAAGMAMFWLSHIPTARLDEFLTGFHQRIGGGATVLLAENIYNPGIGGEVLIKPGHADAYKRRTLADGSQHEIIKNYYDERQLCALLAPYACDIEITIGRRYYWVSYTVQGN